MRMTKISLGVLAGVLLLSSGFAAITAYRLQLPGSILEFKADSTLHGIEGRVTSFSVRPLSFDFEKPVLQDLIEVTFPVRAMDTAMKARDAAMYKTFDADHFPDIVYKAAKIRCVPDTADRLSCTVPGDLTIKKRTLPVPLHAIIERRGGLLHVRGDAALSLNAFDLHPPTILGIIKVFDEVAVHFDTGWAPALPQISSDKELQKAP